MSHFYICSSLVNTNTIPQADYVIIKYWIPNPIGDIVIDYEKEDETRRYQESSIGNDDPNTIWVYKSILGDNYGSIVCAFNIYGSQYEFSCSSFPYTVLSLKPGEGYSVVQSSSRQRQGRASQISGNNGSWTNSDDVKRQGKVDQAELRRRAIQSARDKSRNNALHATGNGKFKLSKVGKFVGKAAPALATAAKVAGMLSGSGSYMFTGSGSYETIGNETITGVKTHDVPTFRTRTDDSGDVVMAYEEYVGKVYSPSVSGEFDVQSYAINPGMPSSFPYMSQIAMNFQQYEFSGLIATFKPNTGLIQSGSMGFITMVFDYNAADENPTSPGMVKNMAGQVTGTPIQTILCGCECDRQKLLVPGGRYIRSGAVPSGQDVKTYDLAKLLVCLYGINGTAFPPNTVLGELHLSYRVRLIKPKMFETLGFAIPTDNFVSNTGVSPTLPFGTAPQCSSHNYLGGSLSNSGTSVYTFPDNFSGYVMVIAYASGSDPHWAVPIVSGRFSYSKWFTNNGGNGPGNTLQAPSSGVVDNRAMILICYRVEQAVVSGGNTLTFALASGNLTVSQLMVTMCNPTLGSPWTSDFVPA